MFVDFDLLAESWWVWDKLSFVVLKNLKYLLTVIDIFFSAIMVHLTKMMNDHIIILKLNRISAVFDSGVFEKDFVGFNKFHRLEYDFCASVYFLNRFRLFGDCAFPCTVIYKQVNKCYIYNEKPQNIFKNYKVNLQFFMMQYNWTQMKKKGNF